MIMIYNNINNNHSYYHINTDISNHIQIIHIDINNIYINYFKFNFNLNLKLIFL